MITNSQRQILEAVLEALPKDYVPDGHEAEACLNHEKYTSACCGCQKQQRRIVTLDDVRAIINEFLEKESLNLEGEK